MKKLKSLTLFSLVMMTVGSVDSIRNLPATALFGSQLIFFFIFGALFFLIPTALISAQLASSCPKQGGVYIWIKEAFGKQAGFLAIWLQWIENVIWYPTILSFVAGTIGYLINPQLAQNPVFLWAIIICAFWGVTLINLLGIKASAFFSNLCAITGLFLPMALIISLGISWLVGGNVSAIHFGWNDFLPNLHDSSMWVSLTAIMLSFCGIEIATVHANDVHNPKRSFPLALLLSVVIILVTLMFGSLAIAVVLPQNEINLVAGIMQAFNAFFAKYNMLICMPFITIMLVLGGLGGVSNWIIAPTKGLLVAANDGNLPEFFKRVNRFEAPTTMLILQAIIVTLLTSIFLFMPSVNGSYWLLTALAAQLYMFMYLLMFAAAIKLARHSSFTPGYFKIPGGFKGLVIVASIGIIGTLTTLVVSFMPPAGINVGSVGKYELMLVSGFVLMCLPPFISLRWQRRKIPREDTVELITD